MSESLNQYSRDHEHAAHNAANAMRPHFDASDTNRKLADIETDPSHQEKLHRHADWREKTAETDAVRALEATRTLDELSNPNRELPTPHAPAGADSQRINTAIPDKPLSPDMYGGGD